MGESLDAFRPADFSSAATFVWHVIAHESHFKQIFADTFAVHAHVSPSLESYCENEFSLSFLQAAHFTFLIVWREYARFEESTGGVYAD
jgi:hypothetical protein